MYAMVTTHPEIAFAVGVISRFLADPGKMHSEATKAVIRYLKSRKDLCICFGKQKASVICFTNADYAGGQDCRKLISGYVFTFTGAV